MADVISLAALEKQVGVTAAVVRYAADSSLKLWWSEGADGLPPVLAQLNGRNRLIVDWCAPAPEEQRGLDAANIAQDLTPLDWALALAVLCACRALPVEGLRVHIVDRTGHAHASAWAALWKQQLLAELPWVTLHAPLVPGGRDPARYRRGYHPLMAAGSSAGGAPLLVASEDAFRLAEVGEPMTAASLAGSKHPLERLARQWSASLVQGADHHNVNNLVGPAIIARVLKLAAPPATSALVHAFVAKLAWTGQLPTVGGPWEPKTIGPADLQRKGLEQLRVLVVDDELGRGWGALVCNFFSKTPSDAMPVDGEFVRLDSADRDEAKGVEVWGCTSSLPLLAAMGNGDRAQQFRMRDLSFSFTAGGVPELLVLDLRLASRVDSEAARHQVREILALVRSGSLHDGNGLAWRPIPAGDIRLLQFWLDSGGPADAPTEAAAITLLARVLALAAPLTPILLFSSTGRTDVKEKLKPYRNVLTAFGKPRVLQDFAELQEATSAFFASMVYGLNLLVRRDQLAACARVVMELEKERKDGGLTYHAPGSTPHIDFYFDESRSHAESTFGLGSAAAVFQSREQADKLQNYLKNKALRGRGRIPVWAMHRDNKSGEILPKHSDLLRYGTLEDFKDGVRFVADEIATSGARRIENLWTSLRLMRHAELPEGVQRQDLRAIDEHLDLMLNFSVQFNFIILPRYLGIENGTCSLHFDRRSIPPFPVDPNYADPSKWNNEIAALYRARAEELVAAFGYEITEPPLRDTERERNPGAPAKKILVTTYPVSAFYPLVREALLGWATEWVKRLQYRTIRGQQLSKRDPVGDAFESRRWLHDIADWVVGPTDSERRDCLDKLFPIRMEAALDDSLQACMTAARWASKGRDVECIRALLASPHVRNRAPITNPVERILVWASEEVLRSASGEALHVDVHSAELYAEADAHAPAATLAWPYCVPAGQELLRVRRLLRFGGGDCLLLETIDGVERGLALARPAAGATDGRLALWSLQKDPYQPAKNEPKRALFSFDRWYEHDRVALDPVPPA
jgi:hypothetical protein